MPQATPADVRLVVAYLATGSTKGAAYSLGITHVAYRARLNRLYRRNGVHNMTTLVFVMGLATQHVLSWSMESQEV